MLSDLKSNMLISVDTNLDILWCVQVNKYSTFVIHICDYIFVAHKDQEMQSESFWRAVAAVADMFESEPVEGSFDEWMSRQWSDFETMCMQMAKHHYIMQTAHRQWRQEKRTQFIDTIERVRLKNLCTQVGLEPNEFIEEAFQRHKNKCSE